MGFEEIKKNIENFLIKYPTYKIQKAWQIEVKKNKDGWEYFLEDENNYCEEVEKLEGKKLTIRRRKWTLYGEKHIDFAECLS